MHRPYIFGFQCHDRHCLAFAGDKFDLKSYILLVAVYHSANVATTQPILREIPGEDHGI
jgi:hypothetical protein